jgi:hypothetical protein
MRFLRSSALTLAVAYIVLGLAALALFAAPMWYAWRVTVQDGRAEILQADAQRLGEVFRREGPAGLISYIDARVGLQIAGERLLVLADPALKPLAGNLSIWPRSVPMQPGTYTINIDLGNGASTNDGRAGMRWTASRDVTVGCEGSVTQTIYEYRIGTGRVYGAALNGAVQVTPEVRVVADGGIYRQLLTNGAAGPDWSQRRASLRLEWTVGNDPGSTRGRAP